LALSAGLPLVLGFVVLVAGEAVGDAIADTAGEEGGGPRRWGALGHPVGLAPAWMASAMSFRWSPRRVRQGPTWPAFGSAVQLLLWIAATWLLAR